MKRELTLEEAALWQLATKDVTPLGHAPVSPLEGRKFPRASEPRNLPYSPRLDLHGVIVHEAWAVVQEHIYQGAQEGYKKLLIITGRSGQINQELPRWLERNPQVRSVTQLANGGSWEITVKPNT